MRFHLDTEDAIFIVLYAELHLSAYCFHVGHVTCETLTAASRELTWLDLSLRVKKEII